MVRACFFVVLAAAVATAAAFAQQDPETLSERERATHVLSRLAFGPRPGEVDEVLAIGVDKWIERQLEPGELVSVRLERALADYPSLGMGCAQLYANYYLRPGDTAASRRRANQMRRVPAQELTRGVLQRALLSEAQLQEVLCEFWRNHFNVSFTKGQPVNMICADYEREVVQANALGSFSSMLEASAKHPAMLIYLDNVVSRRPATKAELNAVKANARVRTGSSEQARQAYELAAQRGLNENYARELLELHTLGVDNYYQQRDVVAVAEALTGWTVNRKEGAFDFFFRPDMHVKGSKRVLGKVVREDKKNGVGEGEAIVRLLAKHKGTADFIATKLCRFLVNDQPSEEVVGAAATAFKKHDGDLAEVMRAILEHDDFFTRKNYRAKFKTPFEFVVSAVRVTGAKVEQPDELAAAIRDMGQPIYSCDPPTGYSDAAEAWLDPGVMALRWQFATDLAEGRLDDVHIPEEFFEQIPHEVPPRLWQHHLTKLILPGGAGERTRAALTAVTDDYLSKARYPQISTLGPKLVGLLLGSPEFQQQ